MKKFRIPTLALVLVTAVAVVGCKKNEPPPPVVVTPAPMPAPMPAPIPVAATASVTAVAVGNAAGPDGKVTMPTTTFGTKDTIIASITTSTSDPAATVAGTLNAKLSYQDGQVVSDEPKSFNFAGPGTTNFTFSKPGGWPVGKYKLDVSLNGAQAQSTEFDVK